MGFTHSTTTVAISFPTFASALSKVVGSFVLFFMAAFRAVCAWSSYERDSGSRLSSSFRSSNIRSPSPLSSVGLSMAPSFFIPPPPRPPPRPPPWPPTLLPPFPFFLPTRSLSPPLLTSPSPLSPYSFARIMLFGGLVGRLVGCINGASVGFLVGWCVG